MKNILLIGQLTDISGYGNAARCYMNNLLKLNEDKKINLSVLNFSFENHSSISDEELAAIKSLSLVSDLSVRRGMYKDSDIKAIREYVSGDFEVVFFLLNDWLSSGSDSETLQTRTGINLNYICKKSKGVYPCVVWETDSIPSIWSKSYEAVPVKSLICSCKWNYDVFSEVSNNREIIPYSVEFENEFDKDYQKSLKDAIGDRFVFSSVFQWGERKGIDNLVKAFYLEFHDNPNVCLLMKTYVNKTMTGQNETEFIRQQISKYVSSIRHYGEAIQPKCQLIILNDILDKKQLNSIYNITDAYVTCTRGEGFGLPIAEAINFEKPVIAPDIGGHVDFIDKENNFFIKSQLEPALGYDNSYWSSIDSNWVEVSINSAREEMKKAYSSDSLVEMGKKSKIFMQRYLSDEKCTNLFEKVLT